MKLLERQPEIARDAPPEPPAQAPPETPADPGARTCKSCGATMAPEQDWCLACGTASGRLVERPGARSALTVLGLTLVLVAGAVAASYAALREDHTVPPAQTAGTGQVAQAPPAATTPPATTPTTTPPASTTTAPAPGSTTGKSNLPKVQVPSVKTPAPAPRTTTTPRATSPSATPTPAPRTPSTGGGGSQTTTPGAGQTTTPGAGQTTAPGAGQTTTPKPAAPVAIDLTPSQVSVYDPYRRATATGAPGKAIDGDGSTSWYVDTAPGVPQVGVGYAVNLGQARGIKSIDITTPTPGFRVEVYATDEATPPPTILDTRWAHITDKSNIGEGGKTHIVLGAGTSKYQTLLLWITKPPSDGTRVRISELKILG
jgi:hypothetical protein